MRRAFTRKFRKQFKQLPIMIKRLALKNYLLWKRDLRHPSLHWKSLAPDVWSIRVGIDYRAVAYVADDRAVWIWIGTHNDFDRVVRQLIRGA